MPQTTAIDQLFLELSQFTTVRTARELALREAVEYLLPPHLTTCWQLDSGGFAIDDGSGLPLITNDSCVCGSKLQEIRKLLD